MKLNCSSNAVLMIRRYKGETVPSRIVKAKCSFAPAKNAMICGAGLLIISVGSSQHLRVKRDLVRRFNPLITASGLLHRTRVGPKG